MKKELTLTDDQHKVIKDGVASISELIMDKILEGHNNITFEGEISFEIPKAKVKFKFNGKKQ